MRSFSLLALAVTALAAGCFSPRYSNGSLRCEGGTGCPDGYHCAVDGACWKNGTDPESDMSVGDTGDLGPGDDMPAARVKHQGEQCGPGDVCDTGNCVDGYCCDSPCTGSCQACNLTGLLGLCSNVGLGASPVGDRTCNAEAPSTCGRDGKCNADGTCRKWPSGTQCIAGTCDVATGNFSNPSTCNGSGTCIANGGGNCAPYKCQDATQCYSSCTDGAQCSGTNSCVSMSCGPLPNGRTCTAGSQCMSGNCVDGYCCNSACNTNTCQACDVPGNLGMCTTVAAGLPHGSRMCTNQGTPPCGGSCDGNAATCTYAGNTTQCGSMCTSSTQLTRSYCDGAGGCPPGTAMTCANNLSCVGSNCLTMCSVASDCAPGYGCVGGMCKRQCVFDGDTFDDGCVFAP